jgi:hypothetical protein
MIESPLIEEIVNKAKCEATRENTLGVLADRFGPVPEDISAALQSIAEEARLSTLVRWAARCPDLDAFRARLLS